ncbi:MAG: nickel transporter [Hyphomicrobiaceae bacterium]|nr:nickel transporter [Hyphomicrobiaceae bacterium]
MRVIPVLDIKAGEVVHASGGDRDRYRPIVTPLAAGSDPVDVAKGLLRLHPFATLYIADLDAIAGRGRNHDTVCDLRRELPQLELWIDDGSATPAAVASLAAMAGVRAVVGSETLARVEDLAAILALGDADPILSLDFKGQDDLGPAGLLSDPARWPRTVIAMTLAAVGAAAGPDLERVRHLAEGRPDADVIAAGGVRNISDIEALAEAGASGALVATALHSGTIKAGDLVRVAGLGWKLSRS